MGTRILRLAVALPPAGACAPRLASHDDVPTYQQQFDRIASQRPELTELHRSLRRLGYIPKTHVVTHRALQQHWAAEHCVTFRVDRWFADVLLAQVEAFAPGVILLDELQQIDRSLRQQICDRARGVVLVGRGAVPNDDLDVQLPPNDVTDGWMQHIEPLGRALARLPLRTAA